MQDNKASKGNLISGWLLVGKIMTHLVDKCRQTMRTVSSRINFGYFCLFTFLTCNTIALSSMKSYQEMYRLSSACILYMYIACNSKLLRLNVTVEATRLWLKALHTFTNPLAVSPIPGILGMLVKWGFQRSGLSSPTQIAPLLLVSGCSWAENVWTDERRAEVVCNLRPLWLDDIPVLASGWKVKLPFHAWRRCSLLIFKDSLWS